MRLVWCVRPARWLPTSTEQRWMPAAACAAARWTPAATASAAAGTSRRARTTAAPAACACSAWIITVGALFASRLVAPAAAAGRLLRHPWQAHPAVLSPALPHAACPRRCAEPHAAPRRLPLLPSPRSSPLSSAPPPTCRYVNNCVGAANLRHFILLLLYVVLSTAYGLAAGLAMGWADRSALLRHTWGVLAVSRGACSRRAGCGRRAAAGQGWVGAA